MSFWKSKIFLVAHCRSKVGFLLAFFGHLVSVQLLQRRESNFLIFCLVDTFEISI